VYKGCKYEIDCVKRRTHELLKKFPEQEQEIMRALDVTSKLVRAKPMTPEEKNDLLNPDELLLKYAEPV